MTRIVVVIAVITLGNHDFNSTLAAQQNENKQSESSQHAGEHQKKHSGHAGESAGVHLEPSQVKSLGIETKTVTGGSARSVLSRPATVRFDPDRTAQIGPRISAKVVKVLKDLGDKVSRGEPLAVMNSVQLGKAKAQFLTAKARKETQEADFKRERRLYKKEISSEAAMLDAKARFREARAEYQAAREALRLYGMDKKAIDAVQAGTEEPLSYFRLTSPVEGTVQKRDLSPGQTISATETPIHLVDTKKVWVFAEAYERDIPHLTTGHTMELQVPSLPGQTFQGQINWISRELDKGTRTIRVRATIKNPKNQLRAGMFGTARLHTDASTKTAMVPVDAVQRMHGRKVVFTPAKENRFKPVPVKTGEESDGWIEIEEGVHPGEKIVFRGAFELKAALTAGERSSAHHH